VLSDPAIRLSCPMISGSRTAGLLTAARGTIGP
jgi:hypothetical protein